MCELIVVEGTRRVGLYFFFLFHVGVLTIVSGFFGGASGGVPQGGKLLDSNFMIALVRGGSIVNWYGTGIFVRFVMLIGPS